jgi:ribosomal protein S18 acetylase RimI-like enzyme
VRPGRSSDLPKLIELWHADVRNGRRDCVPGDVLLRRVVAGLDWEARSRMVEGPTGRLDGAVLVLNRETPGGAMTAIEASARADRPDLLDDLTRWGFGLSKAAGAVAAQVWRGRGHSEGLDRLGMALVRPWWRMDRALSGEPVEPFMVDGYRLCDASGVRPGAWADAHNRAFADHWRFSPRSEDELMSGRPPELSLMAVAKDGSPAALALCQVETYSHDLRAQPVGVISSVGTLPAHRRRGLATSLVAEALRRLHRVGACHASLYVDGWSPMRAFDAYRKVGFELAFETEVWEATFR